MKVVLKAVTMVATMVDWSAASTAVKLESNWAVSKVALMADSKAV